MDNGIFSEKAAPLAGQSEGLIMNMVDFLTFSSCR